MRIDRVAPAVLAALIRRLPILLPILCAISPVQADTADNVRRYSEAEILSAGKAMADAVSRAAPAKIDAATTLLGAVFVPDTKTFIYRYETTVSVDRAQMMPYLVRHTCADPIRKALMYRGVTFKHVYLTPSGQEAASIKYQSCD